MVDLLAFLLTAFHPEVVNPLLQRNGTVRIEKKKNLYLQTQLHMLHMKSPIILCTNIAGSVQEAIF